MKSGQITIFLLLGIVLLIVFGFLFYASKNLGNQDLQDDAEKIYNDFMKTTSLSNYVADCLEVSAKNGLKLAALQGGVIYDNQIKKTSVPDNLILYYSFNENEEPTGKVTDHALGITGDIHNLKWTLHGRYDSAYEFNGKNSYIFVDDPSLDFDSDEDFSISIWFRTNASNQTIITSDITSQNKFNISITKDGKLICSIGNRTNKEKVESGPSLSLTNDLWHHVVCSFDRPNTLSLYIDTMPTNPVNISTLNFDIKGPFYIGTNGINYFNGTLDEIAIFKKSLNYVETIIDTNYGRIIKSAITPNDYVPVDVNKIYTSPSPDEPPIYNISYGIKQPVAYFHHYNINKTNFNFMPPKYPYLGQLISNPPASFNDTYFPQDHGSLFAYYSLHFPTYPMLCNHVGPNLYNYAGAVASCETYSDYNYSIQSMLREYIINQTKECVNFDFFVKNYRYNITKGEITGDVLFGDTDVITFIDYPITVNIEGKPPTTKVERFNKNIDIPFKKLHELAKHIIGHRSLKSKTPKTESDNIFFNITNDPFDCRKKGTTSIISCIPKGLPIKIEKYNNYCITANPSPLECNNLHKHYQYSHIIKLTPNKTLDGKYFTFLFAVENRIPVLDFIDESIPHNSSYSEYLLLNYGKTANTTYNKSFTSYNPDNYNIVVEVGNKIEIFPFGIDPDNEAVTYSYSGWKTPIRIMNETKNPVDYEDPYLETPSSYIVSGGIITTNHLEESNYYVVGFNLSTEKNKDAYNITMLTYPSTLGSSNISDVGYHWIRVNITDNEGLHDYQDIKIHVKCPTWHSCCNITTDYHWYKTSDRKVCDLSDGWPCLIDSHPIRPSSCQPNY